MDTPSISVIIPIYNQEKYLYRSLSSIDCCTFDSYEVLLIDDGSTDKSKKICLEYCNKNPRFKYIHKENGGVASARQLGVDKAIGQYLIHVDPDDWVEPNYLGELFAEAVENDADIVICDYIEEYENSQNYFSHEKFEKCSIDELKLNIADGSIWGICWNKLVKHSVITVFNIKFEKGINFQEDKLYTYRLLCNVSKVRFVKQALYHYNRSNPYSMVSSNSCYRLCQSWDVKNIIVASEKNLSLLTPLKNKLVTLGNVAGFLITYEIPIKEKQDFLKIFKGVIRRKCILSDDDFKTKVLAFLATFYLANVLYNWILKKRGLSS